MRLSVAFICTAAIAAIGCAKTSDKPATHDSTASPRPTTDAGPSITWDAATKTATIPIVAGLTGAAGGWNFNGHANGEMRIIVPVGTKVVLKFSNQNVVPHSAIIVTGDAKAIPPAPGIPAFRGAATRDHANGTQSGGTDEARFTAAKAGSYLLVCGIPGHAQSMWDWFEVSATATAPSVNVSISNR